MTDGEGTWLRVPLRVEWVDTDAGGRIHHSTAFRWAERAEHELLRAARSETLTAFPRRHVEATFHRVLGFDDEFVMEICISKIGTTSLTYRWRAMRDGALCIEGMSAVVFVGDGGKPAPVSEGLREGLRPYFVPEAEPVSAGRTG